MHVMVFSDGVPIDQEIALKEEASSRGLIVMGPDCGTTIINGVGLGFANVVQPGPVGIAGASGTGIQQVCCLVDAAGVGVRHALGTGSRDLSAEVAARSILRALEALEADPAVEIIILVSKPPDPEVAETVATAIEECRTPVVTAFLGAGGVTLEGAAREAVQRLGGRWVEPPVWLPEEQQHRPGFLRGLFAGGSLQHEARTIVGGALEPISSEPGPGHWLVDFGADRYTSGRPHPMIDPEVRLHELEAVIADPETGCILLDVVLGHGAHPDPSAGLAPFVVEASEQNIGVIVSLCGTAADPQNREAQASTLSRAGAEVYLSNAAAGRRALAQVAQRWAMSELDLLLDREPVVATVGVDLLAAALEAQVVKIARTDWRPPVAEVAAALVALASGRRTHAANRTALDRMLAARPVLTDVVAARDVIPGLSEGTLLHAGPPITWEHCSGPLRGALIGAILYEGLAGDARRTRSTSLHRWNCRPATTTAPSGRWPG